MTPHVKSALEIGGLAVAAFAVLWYVRSQQPQTLPPDDSDTSLPIYGGAANPGTTTASIPAVTPISGWNTLPDLPPSQVPGIIWPDGLGAGGLAAFLNALNPNSGSCNSYNPLQALVTSTPPPYTSDNGSVNGVFPPATAYSQGDLSAVFG